MISFWDERLSIKYEESCSCKERELSPEFKPLASGTVGVMRSAKIGITGARSGKRREQKTTSHEHGDSAFRHTPRNFCLRLVPWKAISGDV